MSATIQDIFIQFNPTEALEADDPRYVDCNEARGMPSIFNQLSLPLLDPPPRTLLFSGHVGDGKTTLLKQLERKLEQDRYFVAFVQADERLNIEDVEAEDVILLILAVVDQMLRQRYRESLEDGVLKQRLQEIFHLLTQDVNPKELSFDFGLGQLTADIKNAPGVRQELRARLRQARGPTFLEVANQYLHRAREILYGCGRKQLVVILDGFDRLTRKISENVTLEQRLLLDQSSQLESINGHIIYTVSLPLARKEELNLSARYGHHPIMVPLIPPVTREGRNNIEGMAKLKEIIERRLQRAGTALQQTFDDETTVERLCKVNGGYLRGLMTLVRSVCAEALTVHDSLPLTREDAEVAIQRFGAQQRNDARRYHEVLNKVLAAHSLAEVDDEIQQALLDRNLVHCYYDGDYWYDVCAPVKEQILGGSGSG